MNPVHPPRYSAYLLLAILIRNFVPDRTTLKFCKSTSRTLYWIAPSAKWLNLRLISQTVTPMQLVPNQSVLQLQFLTQQSKSGITLILMLTLCLRNAGRSLGTLRGGIPKLVEGKQPGHRPVMQHECLLLGFQMNQVFLLLVLGCKPNRLQMKELFLVLLDNP